MIFTRKKIIFIVIIAVLVVCSFYATKAAYYEYKWVKDKLKRIEKIENRIDLIDSLKSKKVDNIKEKTTRSSKKTTQIKNKLKKDEEAINNKNFTSSDVDSLLSRFEN